MSPDPVERSEQERRLAQARAEADVDRSTRRAMTDTDNGAELAALRAVAEAAEAATGSYELDEDWKWDRDWAALKAALAALKGSQ